MQVPRSSRPVITTAANTSDMIFTDALIPGDERSAIADDAYHTCATAIITATVLICPSSLCLR
jgi:hypothetical protein